MILYSPRWRRGDREAWDVAERADAAWSQTRAFWRRVNRAEAAVRAFVGAGPAYVSVSWGKDSLVTADLAIRVVPTTLLVWIRFEPTFNPDCLVVRDAFLASWPYTRYDEIVIELTRDERGKLHSTGTLERGFARAVERHGPRHLSGVRAEESGGRKIRMRRHSEISKNTCAPIGWWSAHDVYAYLYAMELPVHPAYAMTCGGRWEREAIRVASIGEQHGRGFGRREWEAMYYPELLEMHA